PYTPRFRSPWWAVLAGTGQHSAYRSDPQGGASARRVRGLTSKLSAHAGISWEASDLSRDRAHLHTRELRECAEGSGWRQLHRKTRHSTVDSERSTLRRDRVHRLFD